MIKKIYFSINFYIINKKLRKVENFGYNWAIFDVYFKNIFKNTTFGDFD